MSTSTNPSTQAQSNKGELGPATTGAEILVECLEREGVDTIFAYPGGASMHMHQALTRSRTRSAPSCRATSRAASSPRKAMRAPPARPAWCMATSGPGATNLVTGIADAYLDSTPLVAITGQVPQAHDRQGRVPGDRRVRHDAQIVKHNYLVMDVNDIPRIVKEAFYIAQTGRPARCSSTSRRTSSSRRRSPFSPAEVNLRGYNPVTHADDVALNEVIGLIRRRRSR
jgi:acetolactate synthase-1/2/3 large subunit